MSLIPDPVTAALTDLRFTIPLPILKKVFIESSQRWREKQHSLNERIMEEVVRPRVLQDCNIQYGTETFVDLSHCTYEEVNQFTTIYRVPKELTQGRSIISALSVAYGVPGYGGLAGGWNNVASTAISAGAAAMSNAAGQMPITSTANVQLIGENTVMVRDTLKVSGNLYLRCVLENDERLSHLKYKATPITKELIRYAVKSYIYNIYLIEMDQAEIQGGNELGTFKNIIESYSDAEELYQTCLKEKFARAAISSDHEMMRRFIKPQIGGFR